MEAIGVAKIAAVASSGSAPEWSVERALEVMDRNDVDMAVTSVSAPGFILDDPADLPSVVRRCNDYTAGMVADRPHRFGMFASLPMPDVAACLSEIDYVYDQLNTDGVCLFTNYDGVYLGDPRFRPVFKALDLHGAVVFIHPTVVKGAPVLPGVSQSTMEFAFDTARTAASLAFSGVMSGCRRVKFIFSHAGGVAPYLAHRIETLSHNAPKLREHLRDGVIAELGRHYYDTALSASAVTFGSLRQLVPVEQVLFGTDFPFGPKNQMAGAIAGLDAMGLSASDRSAIDSQNAIRLMPGLAHVRPVDAGVSG
jgi:predicted TIM-barrel fold metal-dependent hydrolase